MSQSRFQSVEFWAALLSLVIPFAGGLSRALPFAYLLLVGLAAALLVLYLLLPWSRVALPHKNARDAESFVAVAAWVHHLVRFGLWLLLAVTVALGLVENYGPRWLSDRARTVLIHEEPVRNPDMVIVSPPDGWWPKSKRLPDPGCEAYLLALHDDGVRIEGTSSVVQVILQAALGPFRTFGGLYVFFCLVAIFVLAVSEATARAWYANPPQGS